VDKNKKEVIIKKILEHCSILEEVLNNELLIEFGKLRNIKTKYNRFSAKQEVIAQRGFFLDVKKKYALWIINNEGVDTEEFDIKGLITKRSDYPTLTKEKIMDIISFLVKDDVVSFKKIKKHIDEQDNNIRSLCIKGDKSIARPVSFSKPLKEYKRVPSHVEGMLLWNKLEYDYFVPGTKGYQFKIIGIDPVISTGRVQSSLPYINFKKNNNVVLPYEADRLPKYYNIDVESMIQFAWVNRYKELLHPIWDRLQSSGKNKSGRSMAQFAFQF